MKISEYASYDGLGLAALVRSGEVSASELAHTALQAIDITNSKLNFIAHFTPDIVEATLASHPLSGSFSGVPFLIKDTAIKNQPYEMGSRLSLGQVAEKDSELTSRFRKAGVTIMGISTMPEAGNSSTTESVLYGPTRNPWNLEFMTGGSSGGSAAAVAAGAVPIAQASDGGGSIRTPAACCGLVGLKPTRARTPGAGGIPFSFGVSHVVSRSLRDTAAMLDCIHGPEVGAVYMAEPPAGLYLDAVTIPPKPLKIGFTTQSPSGSIVDMACIKSVETAAKLCESLGHFVEEKTLPYKWEPLLDAFLALWSYRHPYNINVAERATGRQSSPATRETCNLAMLKHANNMTMLDFDRHLRFLEQTCFEVGQFFNHCDVFISPVNTHPALKLGAINVNAPDLTASLWGERVMSSHSAFTPIFNITGQPAISLPLIESDDELPVGVQFAARHSDEATLIKLAGQLEQALPWIDSKPGTSVF